jgi:long-chain fatty acid transport protein
MLFTTQFGRTTTVLEKRDKLPYSVRASASTPIRRIGERQTNQRLRGKNIVNKIQKGAVRVTFAGGLAVLAAAPQAQASGFSVPELSTAGLGTANAMVANPDEIGAFAYNPAAMSFHDSSSVAIGGLFINMNLSVDNASGRHDSNSPEWVAAPLFQAAVKVTDRWRVGLGATTPFGLETRWDEGTFPLLSGSRTLTIPTIGTISLPNGNQPTKSLLQVLDITPSASYRINDMVSVSAGLDYYWAKQAELDSSLAELQGRGSGLGWNLGLMFRKDAWSLGASYHSATTVAIDGTYTPLDNTLVALGAVTPGQTAKLDLNLPWRLQLGARYAINPQLAVEVDWTRIGWSQFENIEVKTKSGGNVIFTDTNDWEDADAIRLGLTYAVRPNTQLRFGYSYDQTGQPDAHFSARVPDSDRQLFSIGVSQGLGQGFTVEAGYMYVLVDDRNYSGDTQYQGLGTDVNGSTAVAGTYESDVNLFAIELSKVF